MGKCQDQDMKGYDIMTRLLLIPVKLIAKALLYILSAIICVIAWVIGLPAMIFRNLCAIIGGISIIALTIMLVIGAAPNTVNSFLCYGASIGVILIPMILIEIMKACFCIRGRLLGAADNIQLIG